MARLRASPCPAGPAPSSGLAERTLTFYYHGVVQAEVVIWKTAPCDARGRVLMVWSSAEPCPAGESTQDVPLIGSRT